MWTCMEIAKKSNQSFRLLKPDTTSKIFRKNRPQLLCTPADRQTIKRTTNTTPCVVQRFSTEQRILSACRSMPRAEDIKLLCCNSRRRSRRFQRGGSCKVGSSHVTVTHAQNGELGALPPKIFFEI